MPGSPDDPEAKPADLRFTDITRDEIRVDRNLSGDGHLVRGDLTRMSRLNFSAKALPRTEGERDPVFVEREFGIPTVDALAADPAVVEPPLEPPPSLMQRLGRLLSGSGS